MRKAKHSIIGGIEIFFFLSYCLCDRIKYNDSKAIKI